MLRAKWKTSKLDLNSALDTGRQEKVIAVTTSESLDHPTFLRLILDIPRAVVLQPEFGFWKVGEP